jgi:hypothetical protein
MNRRRLLTFCIQTIHHATDQLQLILDTEVDEVGINKHTVWRNKSRVVRQKQRGSDLRTARKLTSLCGET